MAKEYILEKSAGGMHYLLLDNKTVKSLTKYANKRVICKLNDLVEFHCVIMHKREGGHFINIGLPICKKLQIKEGSKVTAIFLADESEYQFEMPEELQEVLHSDPEANAIFQFLTKGNQRGLIYLVAQVKSSDKKIERALKIAEKLKQGIKSPRVIFK